MMVSALSDCCIGALEPSHRRATGASDGRAGCTSPLSSGTTAVPLSDFSLPKHSLATHSVRAAWLPPAREMRVSSLRPSSRISRAGRSHEWLFLDFGDVCGVQSEIAEFKAAPAEGPHIIPPDGGGLCGDFCSAELFVTAGDGCQPGEDLGISPGCEHAGWGPERTTDALEETADFGVSIRGDEWMLLKEDWEKVEKVCRFCTQAITHVCA